jgi:ABC-type sugar transport system substrate-binding protein
MMLGVPDALQGVGVNAGEDVKLITQYDDENLLKMIADGDVEMTIENPSGEQMRQSTDIMLREMLGQDYSESTDEAGAFTKWIITKDNLPPEREWKNLDAVADYRAQFNELWGVEGQE